MGGQSLVYNSQRKLPSSTVLSLSTLMVLVMKTAPFLGTPTSTATPHPCMVKSMLLEELINAASE
jgi:hypothetical protein